MKEKSTCWLIKQRMYSRDEILCLKIVEKSFFLGRVANHDASLERLSGNQAQQKQGNLN